MECDYKILAAEVVSRTDRDPVFAGDCGKFEIGGRIANLQHRVLQWKEHSNLDCEVRCLRINSFLTLRLSFAVNISRMPDQPLHIEDLAGSREGIRILRLSGPLTLSNVFGFQSKVRADTSRRLILDFTDVPLADSAGIGALVGAYVTRQNGGRSLGLVGVNQRIHEALEITRVDNFFRFFGTVAEAEQAS